MKKQEAFNTFSDGMVLDLNPLQMSNSSLSNCLNGTLLTFNGDENVLLNDMGNARVETAMLPTGYVPLGTTSFGGIIYIVSFNPLTKDYQIGSFPSPERNLMKDELGDDSSTYIDLDDFCGKGSFGEQTSTITSYYLKVNLTKFNVHAGDKFKVFSSDLNSSQTSAWDIRNTTFDPNAYPKYVKLDVVSTLDDGKTISLTDDLNWTGSNPFYIYNGNISMTSKNELTLKEYRDLIKANYDVYLNKMAGKLGIAATLEVPTSFSVGYDVLINRSTEENVIDIQFFFYLNWSNNKVGDFKCMNNPTGAFVKIERIEATYPIKLLTDDRMIVIPDNKLGKKYLTTVPPDNYTSNDWDVKEYLLSGNNKFGTTLRKNDGSDFQYLLVGPKIKYNKESKEWSNCDNTFCYKLPDGILDVTVTPIMPFGRLEYLGRTLNINLDKLQTDQINLNSYQYYVTDNNVNMNFNIEYYPSLGNTIKQVDIEFYSYLDNVDVKLNINDREIYIWRQLKTYDDEDLINYTTLGNCVKTITINGNANGFLKIVFDKNNLDKNRIYIAKFIIHCTDQTRVFHRLFFNSSIFNAEYTSKLDFKDLKLYSPNQKGGIKPEFGILSAGKINDYVNLTMNNGVIIPNENNFQYYKTEETLDKINHLYTIFHEIDGYYNIESGLGNELKLGIRGVSKNDVNIEYTSDCNLLGIKYKPEIFTLDNSRLLLSNTFVMEVPYTVDYSDAESLDIYNFKALVKDPNKIRLSHWSVIEEEGYFTLWANKEWENDNYRALFMCPNLSTDIDFYTSDEFEGVLLNMLELNHSDYITAVFGIEGFGDNNRGYAFNVMLDDTSYTLYYKLDNPNNHYHLVNIVRKSDGTAAIIHLASGLLFNDYLNDEIVKNFDDIIKRSDVKDLQVIKNTYKKYAKTGKSKTVFYIKDINNNDKALSVTANYKANVDISIDDLILANGSTISTSCGVTNFTIDDIENVEINLPLTTTIDNTKLIHNALYRDSTMVGWYNDEIINQDTISKVYDKDGFVVPNMSIREKDLLLVYNESNLDKVRWYFGWEDIGGQPGLKSITKDEFNLTKQRYSVNHTYRIK